MAFELRYPNESSPTASWVPSVEPADYTQPQRASVIVQQMADGATQYHYKGATGRMKNDRYVFADITDTDKANFEAFVDAVAPNQFKLKDPITGAFVFVKFAVYEWTFAPIGPNRWGFTLELRRA